jgi:hypothetical protein
MKRAEILEGLREHALLVHEDPYAECACPFAPARYERLQWGPRFGGPYGERGTWDPEHPPAWANAATKPQPPLE